MASACAPSMFLRGKTIDQLLIMLNRIIRGDYRQLRKQMGDTSKNTRIAVILDICHRILRGGNLLGFNDSVIDSRSGICVCSQRVGMRMRITFHNQSHSPYYSLPNHDHQFVLYEDDN